jgi:hypothetical protein
MARTRAHVFVSGTVQGVYFRATAREAAREHGVDERGRETAYPQRFARSDWWREQFEQTD